MLTKDENIVIVAIEVQYRISDVEKYLFNLVNPSLSLKQAADSALRQVIGNSALDFICLLYFFNKSNIRITFLALL